MERGAGLFASEGGSCHPRRPERSLVQENRWRWPVFNATNGETRGFLKLFPSWTFFLFHLSEAGFPSEGQSVRNLREADVSQCRVFLSIG